jgi:hypothetical protein
MIFHLHGSLKRIKEIESSLASLTGKGRYTLTVELAWYLRLRDPKKAAGIARELILEPALNAFHTGILHETLAECHYWFGENEEGEYQFNQAVILFNETKDPRAIALTDLGRLLFGRYLGISYDELIKESKRLFQNVLRSALNMVVRTLWPIVQGI